MSGFLQDLYNGQSAAGEPAPSQDTRNLQTLQKTASTSSALFSIAAAGVRAGDMEKQAGDQLIMAVSEETASIERSNAILRRQMEVDGQMRAAFAASGVDLGSITVQQLGRENRKAAGDALTKTRNTGARRAAQRRYAATALARQAATSFGAGAIDSVLKAAESLAGAGG